MVSDEENVFEDVIKLMDTYPQGISDVTITKSINDSFKSQIQIIVSEYRLKTITKSIRRLNYVEVEE